MSLRCRADGSRIGCSACVARCSGAAPSLPLGHFTLAIPNIIAFYVGLTLIVIGTGLLKPNISAIVGDLYPEGGSRRDAGFSIYYMGINLGGFLGPLVCGYLGEVVDWHLGFGAAGVGMVFGLIQYSLGGRHLGTAGELRPEVQAPAKRAAARRALLRTLEGVAGLMLIAATLQAMGVIRLSLVGFVDWTGLFIVSLAGLYLLYVVFFGGLTIDREETCRGDRSVFPRRRMLLVRLRAGGLLDEFVCRQADATE